MTTFLGTPILLRGVAYGNLYLTEKADGAEFDQSDEELVTLLSAQAAVAIENARLYESATAWSRQLESMQEISGHSSVSATSPPAEPGRRPAPRTDRGARRRIALPLAEGLRVEAIAGDDAGLLLHTIIPRESKIGHVLARGRSERVDAIMDDPEVVQEVARRFAAVTGLTCRWCQAGARSGLRSRTTSSRRIRDSRAPTSGWPSTSLSAPRWRSICRGASSGIASAGDRGPGAGTAPPGP